MVFYLYGVCFLMFCFFVLFFFQWCFISKVLYFFDVSFL